MNNFFRLKSTLFYVLAAFLIVSCSTDSNGDIIIDPNDDTSEFDGELSVFEAGNDNRTVSIDGSTLTESTASVKVEFSTTTNTMRRLYVTQNVSGFGEEPFEFAATGVTVDDKKDGSLDLSSDNGNDFAFEIPFPAPTTTDGSIVYTIWATTGRGDFRDVSKRNAISDTALGTITIMGSGNNGGTGMKTYENITLYAPSITGKSDTFFSLYTGEVYEINPYDNTEENSELVEIWDFGYYYTPVGGEYATLASVHEYDLPGVDITSISGINREDFNQAFFKKSTTLTVTDFDNATLSDLSSLSITNSDSEKINTLSVNDIIEFQDKYGNKGLIKVDVIDLGTGDLGYSEDAFITIDIKIQI